MWLNLQLRLEGNLQWMVSGQELLLTLYNVHRQINMWSHEAQNINLKCPHEFAFLCFQILSGGLLSK